MGAISSNPAQLARLVGVYKGVQSAGAASAFAMDSGGTSYMNELAATWGVGVAGLVFAAPVVAFRLQRGACGIPFPSSSKSLLISHGVQERRRRAKRWSRVPT